jgi:hypothetical protein
MTPELTFKERARLGLERLAKRPSFTLEQMRKQALMVSLEPCPKTKKGKR